MSDIARQLQYLRIAELQFRLASAVRLATTVKTQPLDLPIEWSHGKHHVRYSEIALSVQDADYAAWHLHRSATFLMAVAMKDAIRSAVHDPKSATDLNVQSAYQIARLIRNAFAHAPCDPVWSIDEDCRDCVFIVHDVITLDTKGLHDQPFEWRHYGGPLAMLRLSQFVRAEVLRDAEPPSPIIPMPQKVFIQQGDLILQKIDQLPPGAVPVAVQRLPDGGVPLGGGHVIYPDGKPGGEES
jgi:hypothetical protein